MSEERLHKLMARSGPWSRRQAEELIRQGRVTINGQAASLGAHADGQRDAIKVDGKRLHLAPAAAGIHLLVNKPQGYVSTRHDPENRPKVIDLVPARLRTLVRPVGRLDFDTEGLMLLTDDGELAQRISHPRYGCSKTYEVKVKGFPEPAALDRLRGGIKLYGKKTQPAKIEPRRVRGGRSARANSWWTVTIGEGRTRQIREMFFRIGHPVGRLRRIAIGPLQARGLEVGGCRAVEDAELERLRESVGISKRGRRGKP